MDTSLIYSSGIMEKGENILNTYDGSMSMQSLKSYIHGSIVLTNKRILFVKSPGFFSKGVNAIFSTKLDDITSISTAGLIPKKLSINIKTVGVGLAIMYHFICKNPDNVSSDIKNAKNNLEETVVVEAKRVIIEGGTKEKAMDILQKRLARGEITLEEFHQIVQRL